MAEELHEKLPTQPGSESEKRKEIKTDVVEPVKKKLKTNLINGKLVRLLS